MFCCLSSKFDKKWLESLYNVLPVLQKFHVFTHFNAIKHSIEIFGSYRYGKNCSADNHYVIDILILVYVHRIYRNVINFFLRGVIFYKTSLNSYLSTEKTKNPNI